MVQFFYLESRWGYTSIPGPICTCLLAPMAGISTKMHVQWLRTLLMSSYADEYEPRLTKTSWTARPNNCRLLFTDDCWTGENMMWTKNVTYFPKPHKNCSFTADSWKQTYMRLYKKQMYTVSELKCVQNSNPCCDHVRANNERTKTLPVVAIHQFQSLEYSNVT